MQFIDTHIHLQDYKTKSALQIIREAQAVGVEKLVCAAVTEADWPQVAALAEAYPQVVVPAFGLHPWHLSARAPGWNLRLAAYLQRFPQALLGETGLDRLRNPQPEPQQSIFAEHIALAREYRRPLLIHCVKAWEWMENFWTELPSGSVFHSFTGPAEMVDKIVKAQAYVSFSQSILSVKKAPAVVSAVPAERLLLETDGPYQNVGSGESQPAVLPQLAAEVARLRGEETAALAAQVYCNSLGFINVGR